MASSSPAGRCASFGVRTQLSYAASTCYADVPSLTRKGWDVVLCRALAEVLDKKIVELDGIEPLETALAASHRP